MKYLLVLIFFFSPEAFAEGPVVHREAFKDIPAGSGVHFWTEVYHWDGFGGRPLRYVSPPGGGPGKVPDPAVPVSSIQKQLELPANLMLGGYELGDFEYQGEIFSESDFLTLFQSNEDYDAEPDVEAAALWGTYRYMFQRKGGHFGDRNAWVLNEDGQPTRNVFAKKNLRHQGAVFVTKIQQDLDQGIDLTAVELKDMLAYVHEADYPHLHYPVSHEWAHRFIDPVSFGHYKLQRRPNARAYLSVINTGEDFYDCNDLNSGVQKLLTAKETANAFLGRRSGVYMHDDEAYRTHVVSLIDELAPSEFKNFDRLIEVSEGLTPVKVFIQRVIFSSNLLQSGLSIMAFYEDSVSGKKKMITATVVVMDDNVLRSEALPMVINGVNDESETDLVTWDKKVLVGQLVTDQLTLRRNDDERECGVGLGLGLPSYSYDMSLKLGDLLKENFSQ